MFSDLHMEFKIYFVFLVKILHNFTFSYTSAVNGRQSLFSLLFSAETIESLKYKSVLWVDLYHTSYVTFVSGYSFTEMSDHPQVRIG